MRVLYTGRIGSWRCWFLRREVIVLQRIQRNCCKKKPKYLITIFKEEATSALVLYPSRIEFGNVGVSRVGKTKVLGREKKTLTKVRTSNKRNPHTV